MLVGITAGIRGKVRLGNIIVPNAVVQYEAMKVSLFGRQPQGLIVPTSQPHMTNIKGWDASRWRTEIHQYMPRGRTDAPDFGAMASGDKVVANGRFARAIARLNRKASALEMEAFGVASACVHTAAINLS